MNSARNRDTLTEIYLDVIDEEIEELGHIMSSGSCADFAEYKYKSGIVKGLRVAGRAIEDEVAKIAKVQDDD